MDIDKIERYYILKKAIDYATKHLEKLKKEIKDDFAPGVHTTGRYKVTITLRRKFNIDETYAAEVLDKKTWKECTKTAIDPDLLESAYLRGEITDDVMRSIRGYATVIPSLSVEKFDV